MTNNSSSQLPIYLLGENILSIYLASKFSQIGEKVIIISSPQNNSNKEYIVKEEQSLNKNKFCYTPQPYTFENGKLLIITSPSQTIKSDLIFISPKLLTSTPCLIFSNQQNFSVAENIIGKQLISGWFKGWLQQDDHTITALNEMPEIILSKDYHNLENCLNTLSLLNRTGLKCTTTEDKTLTYWEHFAPIFIGTFLCAKEQQNFSQIYKNRTFKPLIEKLSAEFCELAACDGVKITTEKIQHDLENIPSRYNFSSQKLDSQAINEINLYYRLLINRISTNKLHLSGLNNLMKEIYLRINTF